MSMCHCLLNVLCFRISMSGSTVLGKSPEFLWGGVPYGCSCTNQLEVPATSGYLWGEPGSLRRKPISKEGKDLFSLLLHQWSSQHAVLGPGEKTRAVPVP